ncbi:MAG: hypothetical protein LBC45_06175, partial [Chlamydiales bacterium]|nr:hypothetical protein [Chlamydiales bacterium]
VFRFGIVAPIVGRLCTQKTTFIGNKVLENLSTLSCQKALCVTPNSLEYIKEVKALLDFLKQSVFSLKKY